MVTPPGSFGWSKYPPSHLATWAWAASKTSCWFGIKKRSRIERWQERSTGFCEAAGTSRHRQGEAGKRGVDVFSHTVYLLLNSKRETENDS